MFLLNLLSVASASFETLILAGVVYGWPSLQFVLIQEGYFLGNCSSAQVVNQTHCDAASAQRESLNLVFTLATVALMVSTFPFGYILDRYGTWVVRTIACSFYTLGWTLLATMSPESAALLYPAMMFIAVGGLQLLVTNFQLRNLTTNYKSVYVNVINGLFDSSVVTFFLIKVAYDHGVALRASLQLMACLSVIPWLRTFLLMPRFAIPEDGNDARYGVFDLRKVFGCRKQQMDKELNARPPPSPEEVPRSIENSDGDLENASFKSCLKLKLFWSNLLFFCVAYLRVVFYLGSYINWIVRVQPPDAVNFSANLFGYLLIAGGFTAPINGVICEYVTKYGGKKNTSLRIRKFRGLFASMAITCILQIALSVTVLLNSVYVSLVILLLFRTFLFSSISNFLAQVFPMNQFGKVFGLTYFIAGVFAFLQHALLLTATSDYILLAGGLLTIIHPALIFLEAFKVPCVRK